MYVVASGPDREDHCYAIVMHSIRLPGKLVFNIDQVRLRRFQDASRASVQTMEMKSEAIDCFKKCSHILVLLIQCLVY